MSNVIRPMSYDSDNRAHDSKAFGEARHRWQTKAWRDKWQKAERERDYGAMDRLDREYEMLGMP